MFKGRHFELLVIVLCVCWYLSYGLGLHDLEQTMAERGIGVDQSTNGEAIISCDTTSRLRDRYRRRLEPVRIRQSQYSNNRIEQDHQRIKRRIRPMLGFQSFKSAAAKLSGSEMVRMLRKRQMRNAQASDLSIAEQFKTLVDAFRATANHRASTATSEFAKEPSKVPRF